MPSDKLNVCPIQYRPFNLDVYRSDTHYLMSILKLEIDDKLEWLCEIPGRRNGHAQSSLYSYKSLDATQITLGEGNSSEWPVDVFSSAQKTIEMGEESVKLGVTEDCASRYVGSLRNEHRYFIFPINSNSIRLRTTFKFQWVNNSVLFEKNFHVLGYISRRNQILSLHGNIFTNLQFCTFSDCPEKHFLVETKKNEPARNDLRSYIEY